MNNIKLIKANPKGWFLTIGEEGIDKTCAVTSLELWALYKMISDNERIILEEIEVEEEG